MFEEDLNAQVFGKTVLRRPVCHRNCPDTLSPGIRALQSRRRLNNGRPKGTCHWLALAAGHVAGRVQPDWV